MKKIKLIDFLSLLEFEKFVSEDSIELESVRINDNRYDSVTKFGLKHSFFEFAVPDLTNRYEQLRSFLNEEILNLYVVGTNVENYILNISVTDEKDFDDLNLDYSKDPKEEVECECCCEECTEQYDYGELYDDLYNFLEDASKIGKDIKISNVQELMTKLESKIK